MAPSPQHSIPENHHVDFRAPPPSPIASGRRSSFANDAVLNEYLENSLRVPDLILPDRILPSQRILETPQVVDFQSLCNSTGLLGCDMDSLARLGCFQLVNHGISNESVMSAMDLAQGLIFNVPVEKRATVMVSAEKPYGFEEEIIIHGGDDDKEETSNTLSEEFVWCRDERFKLEMEAILGYSYSNFSVKMEALMCNIEAVGERLLGVVRQKMELESLANDQNEMVMQLGEEEEEDNDHDDHLGRVAELSSCYLRKHRRNVPAERWERSLRYDVIKMLIRGTDHSHALCFHICNALEFHVYSKKGWISFSPEKDALVVTIGDQIQAMSNGEFRHVLGRPMVKSGEDDSPAHNNSISMAFMYSPPPPTNNNNNNKMKVENTISIKQQAILALVFTIVYHILAFLYKIF